MLRNFETSKLRNLKLSASGGYVSAALLISAAVASIILYSLATLVANQYRLVQRTYQSQQALAIAEAGINYYRWHLAHAPNDYQDGTGGPGPYIHTYTDSLGGDIGQFSLEITPPQSGSSIVTITSTGHHISDLGLTRTITAQYGQPSMAQYSFLHNSHIWFGSGLTINGPAHSNGGIRNDGTNNSLVTSALATYTCGSETGCSPSQTRDGVWGAGGDTGLWQYPVTPVDFNAISVDFANMLTAAQTDGAYFGPSGDWGYHVVFNADSTVNVYRVTNTSYYRGYDSGVGCTNLYQNITGESLVGTYQQSTTPIIFLEDTTWLEGIVTHRVQVAAARFPIGTYDTDIWIYGNLAYQTQTGSIQAGYIAQHDLIFARNIPNNFIIDGALLAQTGKIFRHHYDVSWCSEYSNAVRDNLAIYGSVISSLKSYWNWGSAPNSGFITRDITYDPNLRYSPPPYFPSTSDYEFISWTE